MIGIWTISTIGRVLKFIKFIKFNGRFHICHISKTSLMSFSFGFEVDDETGNVVSFWYIYSMVYIHYFNLYSKFNL